MVALECHISVSSTIYYYIGVAGLGNATTSKSVGPEMVVHLLELFTYSVRGDTRTQLSQSPSYSYSVVASTVSKWRVMSYQSQLVLCSDDLNLVEDGLMWSLPQSLSHPIVLKVLLPSNTTSTKITFMARSIRLVRESQTRFDDDLVSSIPVRP